MTHAPAGPFARLPAPIPEATVLAEAERLYNKQAAENVVSAFRMGSWEGITIPVRNAWISFARKRLARS